MLYVYDSEFNRLGMVGKFSYLLWRKRYAKHGEAELRVDATTKNINLLKKGHILWRDDDNEAMYIYYRGFSDDEGHDQLIVKCYSLVRWLDRRTIWGMYNFYDTPENIIRTLIMNECMNPSNPDRAMTQINLASPKGLGTSIQYQASYGVLLDKVESLCNTHDIGIRSVFNGKQLEYEIYQGEDRTINQSVNPRCILSKQFANVLQRTYEEADNDYKNTVLVAGAGEGSNRKLTSIEQGSGLERRELFVDAKDLQDEEDGTPIPDSEYTLMLKERGLEKLFEHEIFISFDCTLDVTKDNTKYGRDFFLGDFITIRDDKLGVIMNSRVEEVDEVFQGTKQVYAKVGKSIPTLTEKVRKMVKR